MKAEWDNQFNYHIWATSYIFIIIINPLLTQPLMVHLQAPIILWIPTQIQMLRVEPQTITFQIFDEPINHPSSWLLSQMGAKVSESFIL